MNEHDFKKRILGPGLISLVIKVAGAVLNYAMIVAFARLLSAEDYGVFASGLNLAIIFAMVIGMGFNIGIMRYWPKFLVENNPAAAKGAVLQGFGITILLGLVLVVVSFIGSQVFNHFFSTTSGGSFVVIAALALMIALGDYSTNLLRVQGSVIYSMLPRDVLWRIAAPFIAFDLIKFGFGLSGITALAISVGVLFLLNLWQAVVIWQKLAALGKDIVARYDFTALRPSLLPLWFSGIVYTMIQQFDVVIVSSMVSKAEAGSYFAAQKTAMLLSLVLITASLVTSASMSELYHSTIIDTSR